MTTETHLTDVTDVVKRKYGAIAKQVAAGQPGTCCGPSDCGCGGADPISDDLYDGRQVRELPLARQNQRAAGADNVEFLRGPIEAIPLPDVSVDVTISNCVVNLSADKDAVLAEAWLVLKPGGRLAISDVVRRRAVRPELARSIELSVGCVAGALEESDYRARLADVGFVGIDVEPTRVYHAADPAAFLAEAGFDPDEVATEVDGAFMSAFVRATR
jgi:arsenite methyltransferase